MSCGTIKHFAVAVLLIMHDVEIHPCVALSPGQTIAICQCNISQYCWAQHVACVWPPFCDVLRHVGCCLLKFENGQISANITQYVATRPNRMAKRMQHVAPNNVAISSVGMLRSFRGILEILLVWPLLWENFRSAIAFWNILYFWQSHLSSVTNFNCDDKCFLVTFFAFLIFTEKSKYRS